MSQDNIELKKPSSGNTGVVASEITNDSGVVGTTVMDALDALLAGAGAIPFTAKGDVLSYDGAAVAVLPVGADGQVLKARAAAASGLEWGAGTASPLTTKGDLFCFAAADARLPIGTDGYVLMANSAVANGMAWTAIPSQVPLSAPGDIFAFNATVPARFPIGAATTGMVLTCDLTQPFKFKWASPVDDAPLTTKGDLLTFSTAKVRLPIGLTDGFVLTVDATQPSGMKWAAPSDQTPVTTKGDIFTFSTVDARLPVGTDGQVLSANSAKTTGLEWVTLADDAPVATAGDLLTFGAAKVILPVGTAGQILTADPAGPNPKIKWAAPASQVAVTTKGDIFTFGAAADRLPVGTDGQILESRSTEATGLKWVASPAVARAFDYVIAAAGGDATTLGAAVTLAGGAAKSYFIKKGIYTELGNIVLPANSVVVCEGRSAIISLGTFTITCGASVQWTSGTIAAATATAGVIVTLGTNSVFDGTKFTLTATTPPGGGIWLAGSIVGPGPFYFLNCSFTIPPADANYGAIINTSAPLLQGTILKNIDISGADLTNQYVVSCGGAIVDGLWSSVVSSHPTLYCVLGSDSRVTGMYGGSLSLGISSVLSDSNLETLTLASYSKVTNVDANTVSLTNCESMQLSNVRQTDAGTTYLDLDNVDYSNFTNCEIGKYRDTGTCSHNVFSGCHFVASPTINGAYTAITGCVIEANLLVNADYVNATGNNIIGVASAFNVGADNGIFNCNVHGGFTDSGASNIKIGNNPNTP